ncbi:sulfated surface glycoprotein 185-like isoform X3 [Panicum virgatum]|uniref:sulfated surface glycoprotein 185-like isoform X3 n=1 Tax=Panicum virgatum TaxID=38727 RepID=UPI0019D52A29|nr:sulfated surface glycoprotein 185-like isoform X3 [Panicum virgatum]
MRRRPRAPAPPSPTPGAAPQYRHRLPRLPSPPPESRRRRPRVEPPSVSPGAVPESRCRPCEEPPGRRRVLPLRAEGDPKTQCFHMQLGRRHIEGHVLTKRGDC